MLNALVQFHNHLPLLIKWLFDFTFEIIFLRGILAHKIESNIEQRGLLKVNIVHDMVHVLNKFIPDKASRQAITEHWRMHVNGEGHEAETVAFCYDGKCSSLA